MVLLLATAAALAASGTYWEQLPAHPDSADGSRYRVSTDAWSIAFDNPGGRPDPDGFNEPPFLLQHAGSQGTCLLDASNAQREGIYRSRDGRWLALLTWSGSATGLEIFDLTDCRRTAQIDTSGGLTLSDRRLTVDPGCEPLGDGRAHCWPGAVYDLDGEGRLIADPEAGRSHTRARLGVELLAPGLVRNPFGPDARIETDSD